MIVNSFAFRKILSLLMTCFILSSCGYELRSVTKLSNFNFDLMADETDLNLQLEELLKEKKNFSNASQDVPQIKITILNHSTERFVGSIGRAARTTQVRLDYKLSYQLKLMMNLLVLRFLKILHILILIKQIYCHLKMK